MRRREVISLLGGALGATAALPFVAAAQPAKMARIGVLMLGTPDPGLFVRQLREGLHELGDVEGQNMTLELRNANGSTAALKSHARELVQLKVDVIVGFQTPSVVAAKEATAEIPIVMCPAQKPVEMGFVASFARPGGNVTGMTTATEETTGKNLDLIREALPAVRRLGVMGNTTDPFHKPFLESIQAAAPKLGFELRTTLISAEKLEEAFVELAKDGVEAVIVQPSLPRESASVAGLKHRLPVIAPSPEFAEAGGLMSYGADPESVYREAATFVDKILKGRKPADLPVQLATKFLLVINLKTATALGIPLSQTLLNRADRVIE